LHILKMVSKGDRGSWKILPHTCASWLSETKASKVKTNKRITSFPPNLGAEDWSWLVIEGWQNSGP
jgi:hypothetical protein